LPEVIVMLPSLSGQPRLPLAKVRVALVPLTDIRAAGGQAKRVIERMTMR
jgi:hypothetical protein